MDGLISKNKSAFLVQRHIQRVVQVVNEILYFAKRFKKKCLIIKVDFQKYFDYVSRRYINYVMTRMGFGTKWILWMYALVFNSSLSMAHQHMISELRGILGKGILFLHPLFSLQQKVLQVCFKMHPPSINFQGFKIVKISSLISCSS